MTGRLGGKVAVVTGGGNGIGRSCALKMAGEGASLLIADLQQDRAASVVAEIEAAGGTAVATALDAASEADNAAMIDLAVERLGGLDILVTAAGISHSEYVSGNIEADVERIRDSVTSGRPPWQTFVEMQTGDWQKVLDVNLTGTMHAVRLGARAMIDGGRSGSIITIASIAAKDPGAGPVAYCTSKAGVWMFTKHAARALAPAGIRVNAIGPGFIDTNMTKSVGEIPEIDGLLTLQIPMGRKGEPDEVASLAVYLASDEASYVCGALIHPHGGWFTD